MLAWLQKAFKERQLHAGHFRNVGDGILEIQFAKTD